MDTVDKLYLAQTIRYLTEAYDKMGEALRGAQASKNEKLFSLIYKKQWEIAELATSLIMDSCDSHISCAGKQAISGNQAECDDCGYKTNDLITKGDHHGGQKTVCRDRGLCHSRGG
jgi:hypothetical protein